MFGKQGLPTVMQISFLGKEASLLIVIFKAG